MEADYPENGGLIPRLMTRACCCQNRLSKLGIATSYIQDGVLVAPTIYGQFLYWALIHACERRWALSICSGVILDEAMSRFAFACSLPCRAERSNHT